MRKPEKEKCEVCGSTAIAALDWHHIVPRTDPNCDDHPFNLAVLCSTCHRLSHSGYIEIIGVYPCTNKHGRILVYKKNDISNVPGIEKPYYYPRGKKNEKRSANKSGDNGKS